MDKSLNVFEEDLIPIGKITEDLASEDGKEFVGEALENSLSSVNSLPSHNSKALVLVEITDILLNSDLIYLAKKFGEKAFTSTKEIKITAEKAKTLSRLASVFAEHQFDKISSKIFEKAWEEAETVEDRGKRIEVFLSIIEDQLEKKLHEKAKNNLDKILPTAIDLAENNNEIVPLAMTIETMAKIRKEKAEELCQRVLEYAQNTGSEDDRRWVISSVAKAFSRIGKHEKSMQLMDGLISSGDSDIQLVEVALTLSEEGQTERALELKDHVNNQDLKDSLMGLIAADLVNKKFVDEALELKEKIEDEFETDLLLKKLVSHFAGEDREKARMYLDEIWGEEMRALAYMELALSHLLDEDHQRAEELAMKAKETMTNSKSETVKLELIDVLIEIGLKDEVYEAAEKINTSEERAIAFGSIAANWYQNEN